MTEKANILMVDDRVENLVTLEAILEPLELNLVRAHSGEEALKRLLEDDFALILLDVEMPGGLSGFETAKYVKHREKTRHVPIIFLTAFGEDPERMFQGYETGAVDYMHKPFIPAVLRSKVSVFVDLHHLKRDAERLAHRALHDDLTGLPNRTLFLDRLEMGLAYVERHPGRIAVLFFDLDGFKAVNDKLGHEAGDQLLVEIASRLRGVLRPCDTLARFGGDEFTILCLDLSDDHTALAIGDRVLRTIGDSPVVLPGGDVHITASVGIALAGEGRDTPSALVRQADAAMYRAKERGKACFEVCDGTGDQRRVAAHAGLSIGGGAN